MDDCSSTREDSAVSEGQTQEMVDVRDILASPAGRDFPIVKEEEEDCNYDTSDQSADNQNDCSVSSNENEKSGNTVDTQEPDTKSFLSLKCQSCGKLFMVPSQLRQHAKVCQIVDAHDASSTQTGSDFPTVKEEEKGFNGDTLDKSTDNQNDCSVSSNQNDDTNDCGDGIPTKEEVPTTNTFLSIKCQSCGQYFKGPPQFKQHAKVCQKDYHCQNCGKIFKRSTYKSSSTFRHSTGRHRRTCKLGLRTQNKPYYCEICGKMTGMQAWMLKRHVKSCSSERVCHVCEKIFKSNYHWQIHRCTGSRERGMEKVIVNVEVEVD